MVRVRVPGLTSERGICDRARILPATTAVKAHPQAQPAVRSARGLEGEAHQDQSRQSSITATRTDQAHETIIRCGGRKKKIALNKGVRSNAFCEMIGPRRPSLPDFDS